MHSSEDFGNAHHDLCIPLSHEGENFLGNRLYCPGNYYVAGMTDLQSRGHRDMEVIVLGCYSSGLEVLP